MQAQRGKWLVASAALAGLLAWAWSRSDAPRVAPRVAPRAAPSTRSQSLEPDGSPVEAAPTDAPAQPPAAVGSPRSAPPAPVSASAPAGCPEDEPDPPSFVRPSVWELLRLPVEELNDRLPSLAREASPALRQGLLALRGDDPRAAVDRLLGAPDRIQDGFDVALAGLLHAGARTLSGGDLRTAERLAERGVRVAPTDPLAHALAALVYQRLDDPSRARDAMSRAHALLPDEPALALASARLSADAAHFEQALTAVDGYLTQHPEDVRVVSWRARIAVRRELTARHRRRAMAGIDLSYGPAELSPARVDEVARALRESLEEVARLTRRSRRAELAVVVYSDRESMRRATCTPSWTGAVFDGVLHLDARLLAGDEATWRRVVRHEGSHAQLGHVRGRIPTWLNEGLAQWMEGEPAPSARDAWARMTRDRFWIPFASLEGELLMIDDARDASRAYHQCLAMVLYLMDERGVQGVAEAIDAIETGRSEDLLDHVVGRPVTGEALLASLRRHSAR